jgi:hypothetical protein
MFSRLVEIACRMQQSGKIGQSGQARLLIKKAEAEIKLTPDDRR